MPEDAVAVLYLGRLSAHAKAHPLPMFRALGRAAELTPRPIVAVLAGLYHDADTRRAFEATAAALAPRSA